MKIVLAGASGRIGSRLLRDWEKRHHVTAFGRETADFRNPGEVRRRLAETDFEVLVNCAAVATPEACERDPDGARLVNAETPRLMAEVCGERGARMIHLSTDYVLDGARAGLKDESAPAAPVNAYGRSKLAGEEAVLASCGRALVCRTSWVFGTSAGGFLEAILGRARRGERLEAVDDKWSKPTSMCDLGRWLGAILEMPEPSGLLHLANSGSPETWWSYGTAVLAIAAELGAFPEAPPIERVAMESLLGSEIPRPLHTAMEPRRLASGLGLPVRSWELAAREHIGALLGAGESR